MEEQAIKNKKLKTPSEIEEEKKTKEPVCLMEEGCLMCGSWVLLIICLSFVSSYLNTI